jgi:uncharacterized protein (DUF433 family)
MADQGLEQYARTVPLYTLADAARIIGMSHNTLQKWTRGYDYPTTFQGTKSSRPLVTSTPPQDGLCIPFDGLAEAFVLTRLRAAGVKMPKIRPAVEKLGDEFGITHALLSERLKTDGATVLFEYTVDDYPGNEPATSLAEVTSKQMAFEEGLEDSLQTISYSDHVLHSFMLPRYDLPVVVDPSLNAGRPTLAEYWVRLEDLQDRVDAGEDVDDVADDYGIPESAARALVDA